MAQRGPWKQQEIAVFGESGSGKTVMLSSFYGGTQDGTPVCGMSPRRSRATDTVRKAGLEPALMGCNHRAHFRDPPIYADYG